MKRIITASNEVKPLSKAEQARCDKAKAFVMKCYDSATEDFYEEEGDEVYSEPDVNEPNKNWTIDKGWLVYTSSYDENDRRVKRGGKVPGTTFYTVTFDSDVYDEVNFAQLTLEDAKHFLEICKADRAEWFNRLKNR